MIHPRPPTPWLKKSKANQRSIFSKVFLPASQEIDKVISLNKDYFSQPALPSSPLASSALQMDYFKFDSPHEDSEQSYTPIFAFIDEYFNNDMTTPNKDIGSKSGYGLGNWERSYFSDDSSDSSGEDMSQNEDDFSSSENSEIPMDPYLPTSEAQYKLRMRIYYQQKLRSLSVQHNPPNIDVMGWIRSVNA